MKEAVQQEQQPLQITLNTETKELLQALVNEIRQLRETLDKHFAIEDDPVTAHKKRFRFQMYRELELDKNEVEWRNEQFNQP